jgi:hypothetical protein
LLSFALLCSAKLGYGGEMHKLILQGLHHFVLYGWSDDKYGMGDKGASELKARGSDGRHVIDRQGDDENMRTRGDT